MEVLFEQPKLDQSPVESNSVNHQIITAVIRFLSTSDFIIIVNVSRSIVTHSYAQALNTRQTRQILFFRVLLLAPKIGSAVPDYVLCECVCVWLWL